jgi:hypothetical protein
VSLEADVLAALDDTPRTARDIHTRVDCWEYTSVRQACLRLVVAGSAERTTEPGSQTNITRNLFRRAQRK